MTAQALGGLDAEDCFDHVTLKQNLDYTGLRRALAEFSRTADGAETAIVYYAGHSIEVGGQNYLIPLDAKLLLARDVDYEAPPLSFVMSALKGGAEKLRIVVLHACRNNPFPNRMVRTGVFRSGGGICKRDGRRKYPGCLCGE